MVSAIPVHLSRLKRAAHWPLPLLSEQACCPPDPGRLQGRPGCPILRLGGVGEGIVQGRVSVRPHLRSLFVLVNRGCPGVVGTTVGRGVLLAAGSPHVCSSVTRTEFQTSHGDIPTHKYLCVHLCAQQTGVCTHTHTRTHTRTQDQRLGTQALGRRRLPWLVS